MGYTTGLLDELKKLAAAGRAGNYNIKLNGDGLSGEEAEIIRVLNEAADGCRSAMEYDLTKYKLMSHALDVALWDMDVVASDPLGEDNKFTWSQEFRHKLGFKDESDFPNVLRSWSSRIHPEDQEVALNALAEHLKDPSGGTYYDVEYRMMTKDGNYRNFRDFGTTQRDKEGVPVRVAGGLMDITEKKRMDAEIREANARTNRMMREIEKRDILLQAVNNTAKELLTANDEMFEAALLDSMKTIGRCVDVDCIELWMNKTVNGELHADLLSYWYSEECPNIKSGPTVRTFPYSASPRWDERFLGDECINGPISALSKEDREFLSPFKIISTIIIPLFLENKLWGFCCIDDCRQERTFSQDENDILRSAGLIMLNAINRRTEKKKTEELAHWYKSILDATPFPISVTDSDMNWTFVNRAVLDFLGTNLENIRGKHCSNWNSHICGTPDCGVVRAKRGLKRTYFNHKGRHHQVDTEALTDIDGAVSGFIEVVQDITELQTAAEKIEAALEEAQKANSAKTTFLAKMSHEMRTPLNAVIGISALILGENRLHDEDRAHIETIYNAGSTLLGTVNDILDISKIEAGKLELVPIEYEVPSLINDAVTQNIMRIGERPIELILDLDGDLYARLFGDELRVKQIINNLLSNAIKYTREGRVELIIRNERDNGAVWLTVQVRDSGTGIRPEDIEKLFTEYAQADMESNRKIEGTGLGLPLAKSLVALMDGTIEVESEYGKGSTFTVNIRQGFVTDVRIDRQAAESLKNFRYSDNKYNRDTQIKRVHLPYARVLVVDDNPTNLEVARGLMKPYGMKIDCVDGGQKAVDAVIAGEVRYNAIFMDHMMPGMDGIETARAIRSVGTDYALNVPIIALTANAIVGNEEMFLSNGFQAFLSKPINIPRLDEAIRYWVRDKEREVVYEAEYPEAEQTAGGQSEIKQRMLDIKIAGLDITEGLLLFGGDGEMYSNILRLYAINTPPLLDSIERFSGDGLNDYRITVHSIKGTSYGIAAGRIGKLAEDLENAAKAGDLRYINEQNPAFIKAARKFIQDLEGAVSGVDTEKQKPKKDKPDGGALSKLLAACEVYDIDGVDAAMAEIEGFQYEADDGLVDWLRENVDMMELAQIAERLRT